MQKVEPWRHFPEYRVTVYQDDTIFWKFYLVSDYVSVRKDKAGKPVFLLTAYSFGDQDREENPNLPRGGGYLAMDTEMRIEPDDQSKIVAALQQNVNDIWNQLKAMADRGGQSVSGYRLTSWHHLNGHDTSLSLGVDDVLLGLGPSGPGAPPGDAPPKVVAAEPQWVNGKFKVFAPQSGNLIANRVAEGPLSLLGGNVAAANLDLTSAGATFMVKSLTGQGGSGADLTPLQVRYDLEMMVKLPKITAFVEADSREVYESVKSIYHNYDGRGCDDDEITHSEHAIELAVSSGAIRSGIHSEVELSPEVMEELNNMISKMINDLVKDKFFDRKPRPPVTDDKTKDFIDKEADIYYMKSESSIDFSHFGFTHEIETAKAWPVHPQGTIQAFLSGMSPEELKQYVRLVDLDDPFFKTLQLKATVFGVDWANDPIDFVEAQFRYSGKDENGQQVDKSHSMIFKKDLTEDTWDPSLIGAKRDYSYRWRIGYRGHAPSEYTKWIDETTNKLAFAVGKPGKVAVKFLTGNIDFGLTTKSVQVDVEYEDTGAGVPKDGTMLQLNPAVGEQSYNRWIFSPVNKPLRYRTRFFLKNDQTIESPWQETVLDQLFVNEPNANNRLDVQVIAAGAWDDVEQCVVNLRYRDPRNGISSEGLIKLAKGGYTPWSVFVEPSSPRTFEYKVFTTFKDGSSDDGGNTWRTGEGDQALAIKVRPPAQLRVELNPVLVDFKASPVVEVGLHYDANSRPERETYALTAPTDRPVWRVPLDNPANDTYFYKITYNTPNGEIVIPERRVDDHDNKITVQKLQAPEISVLFSAKLLNLVQTPVVEVDVHYEDPANGIDETETFLFTDQNDQMFRLLVKENSPKEYEVAIKYYLADGTIVERPSQRLEQTKVVVPRYVPTPK
ncbi:hypothetical protein AB5J62_23380 [Amycolatopsis sp. cg5]|uniref:hypothetical protein n=1 Tax=Amycolatopsis sp. cg5 TaxID=3238802 RepID=UPI0035242458